MAVEVRRVDSKGRIYLTTSLRGKEVYLVRNKDYVIIAFSREKALELSRKYSSSDNLLQEYISLLEELGEPSPKEIEKSSRRKSWKKLLGF